MLTVFYSVACITLTVCPYNVLNWILTKRKYLMSEFQANIRQTTLYST